MSCLRKIVDSLNIAKSHDKLSKNDPQVQDLKSITTQKKIDLQTRYRSHNVNLPVFFFSRILLSNLSHSTLFFDNLS